MDKPDFTEYTQDDPEHYIKDRSNRKSAFHDTTANRG